ncbi:MAG: phosphoribosyltransferase family protein [Antarcticimicrobium sp.]|uniref:phosphoribosyltransferase n=1 Tax=Antarcticimicrobium sp. TaxID=2824147 RepID=UPI002623C36F|nr:phosphoribosyltransferase family protein [Antarcticimicrobium sp.]MDF1718826.1 phosphoribosyltransferase family protein [Antarcticimicrobium sp.]
MFQDRYDAGQQLARAVARAAPENPVVLALPRGGVPLAAAVARALGAPLDLVLVRKIGMPGHDELAAGAIVDGPAPTTLFNTAILRAAGLSEADFAGRIEALKQEIEARRARYLPGRAPVPLAGRTAIIVDDGIATGATVRVAIKALRAQGPAAVWVAVPVASADMVPQLQAETDRLICLETPQEFWAVGAHYRNFGQVDDDEVIACLRKFDQR